MAALLRQWISLGARRSLRAGPFLACRTTRGVQMHALEGQGRLAAAKRLSAFVSREAEEFGLPMFGSTLRAMVALTRTHHLPAQQLQFVLQEARKRLSSNGNRDAAAWVQVLLPLLQLASVRSYRNQDMIATLQLVSSTLCDEEVRLSLVPWDAVQCAAALLASGVSDAALVSSLFARLHSTPRQQLSAIVASAEAASSPSSDSLCGVFVDVPAEMQRGGLYRSFTKDNSDPFFDTAQLQEEQPASLQARVAADPVATGHDAMCMALACGTAHVQLLDASERATAVLACAEMVAAITDTHHYPPGTSRAPSLRGLAFVAQSARQATAAASSVGEPLAVTLSTAARRLEGYLHKHLLQSMHVFVGDVKSGTIVSSHAARVVWQLLQQLQQLPSMLTARAQERHSRLGRLLHAQRNWIPYQFNDWPPGYLSRALSAVAASRDLSPAVADGYAQSALHALARHCARQGGSSAAVAHTKDGIHGETKVLFDGVVHPALVLSAVTQMGSQTQGRLLQHVPLQADSSTPQAKQSIDLMAELVRSSAAACSGTRLSVEAGKLSVMLGSTARVLRWRMHSTQQTGTPWQQSIDEGTKSTAPWSHLDSHHCGRAARDFCEFLAGQLQDSSVYTFTAAAACMDGVLALHAWSVQQAPVHDAAHLPAVADAALGILQECLTAQLSGLPPSGGLKRVHCDTTRAVSQWLSFSRTALTGTARTAVQSYMSAVAAAPVKGSNPAQIKQHNTTRRQAQQILARLAQ